MTFIEFAKMCLNGGMKWEDIKQSTLEGVPEEKKAEIEEELKRIKAKIDLGC